MRKKNIVSVIASVCMMSASLTTAYAEAPASQEAICGTVQPVTIERTFDKSVLVFKNSSDCTTQLKLTDGQGTPDGKLRYEWKTSDPKVAVVDASGFVHPVGPGTAEITAECCLIGVTYKATMKVIVGPFKESVTGLVSGSSAEGAVTAWKPVQGASGYYIYGIRTGENAAPYQYIGQTTQTRFVDTKASAFGWNYYWVVPYWNMEGKTVIGKVTGYVYAKKK